VAIIAPPSATPVPGGATIQIFGDSYGAAVAGHFYQPPGATIAITGDTTNTSTTVANLSSISGLQVGAHIAGTGIPNSATIATLSSTSLTLSAAATATNTGVALSVSTNAVPAIGSFTVGLEDHSALGWLLAFSEGGLHWSPTTGYGGNASGLLKVVIVSGGSGWPNSGTFTVSGITSTRAPVATWVASGGVLQSVTVTDQGLNLSDQPTLTDPGGSGTGATFSCVLGGTGTLAASSDKTSQMLARSGDVTAARPDWLLMASPCTNDVNASIAAATTITNLTTLVDTFTRAGIRPVVQKLPGRRVWSNGNTFAQNQRVMNSVNNGIESLSRRARTARPAAPAVLVASPDRYWVDAADSSTPGRASTGMVRSSDNIHPSVAGAFWQGVAFREVMAPFTAPNRHTFYGQDDAYDATLNPGGNLLTTKGLFIGTSGTNSTALTGTVATGWTWQRGSGSGTLVGTMAAQARTDALTGTEQYINITSITGGAATDTYQMRVGTSTSNIASGDAIYMTAHLRLSNFVRVNRIGLTLTETMAGVAQNAYALDAFADTSSLLPDYTVLRNMRLAGILPGFVQGATDGGFELFLRTQPITVRPNTSGYSTNINIGFEANSGSPQATLQVRNTAVRKVV
jgi:hypothetical protein